MTEEPRLDQAVRTLMEMLDDEVPKALVGRPSWRHLDAPVVREAEVALDRPKQAALQDAKETAREKVRCALYEWLEATHAWMHQ